MILHPTKTVAGRQATFNANNSGINLALTHISIGDGGGAIDDTTGETTAPSKGYTAGANFIVPPGYPNDTYPMRVSSGERVIVEPRNVANNSVTNNWNVNADQAGMALLLERQRMMNSLGFEMRM